VIGAGLYLAVLGLFALAAAAIIRHTAGAITAVTPWRHARSWTAVTEPS
jgi:hypothetical protein